MSSVETDTDLCQNCGAPAEALPGDGRTNTCEVCGHPIESSEEPTPDDPYAF